jgi:hypothetical protein
MRELFIKAMDSESLAQFAGRLAAMSQSSPWEKRDSDNYPGGYYFRHRSGGSEIIAQISDDTRFPTADFLVSVTGKDYLRQADGVVDALAQHGYTLLNSN